MPSYQKERAGAPDHQHSHPEPPVFVEALENELQRKLNFPCRPRTVDLPERGSRVGSLADDGDSRRVNLRNKRGAHAAELRVVEEVEEFGAELEARRLCAQGIRAFAKPRNLEVLENRKVPVVDPGARDVVDP